MEEILSVSVSDEVKADEIFGKMDNAFKKLGIAGTLHLAQESQKAGIVDAAWNLANQTGLPVIIVVRPVK